MAGQTVAPRAVAVLLDLFRDDLVRAEVDLFTGCRALPADVQLSLDRLKVLADERHERRRRGPLMQRLGARFSDPLMAVALDLRLEEHYELLRSFGPFSINAEVYGKEDGDSLITIDDSGTSVVFRGNADVAKEVEALAGLPPDRFRSCIDRRVRRRGRVQGARLRPTAGIPPAIR